MLESLQPPSLSLDLKYLVCTIDVDIFQIGNSFFSLIEIMVLNYGASIIMVDT